MNDGPTLSQSYPNGRTSLHKLQQLRLGCAWISQHQQVNIPSACQTIRQPNKSHFEQIRKVVKKKKLNLKLRELLCRLTSSWSPQTEGMLWPSSGHRFHRWTEQESERGSHRRTERKPEPSTPLPPEGRLNQWLHGLKEGEKDMRMAIFNPRQMLSHNVLHMLTCSFSIHFNADHTQVRCSDAHAGSLIATFGFGLSHLFDGVDAHHSYSVAWHYTVTQVPGR